MTWTAARDRDGSTGRPRYSEQVADPAGHDLSEARTLVTAPEAFAGAHVDVLVVDEHRERESCRVRERIRPAIPGHPGRRGGLTLIVAVAIALAIETGRSLERPMSAVVLRGCGSARPRGASITCSTPRTDHPVPVSPGCRWHRSRRPRQLASLRPGTGIRAAPAREPRLRHEHRARFEDCEGWRCTAGSHPWWSHPASARSSRRRRGPRSSRRLVARLRWPSARRRSGSFRGCGRARRRRAGSP